MDVTETIGTNIERARRTREMTGRDLSARLRDLGAPMSVATVSEVERGKRKVSAAELLIFSVALNTSVIDLLTPNDGSQLEIAENIDPIPWAWLESWIGGNSPWPPHPTNSAYTEQFFETASEWRKLKHRTDMRPEMQELSVLRSAVAGAIDGPSEINQIREPALMAEYLRDQLDRVNTYVKLLADHIEKNGYGAR
ncbi:helix-turn-helix transcriptional regulator [Mycolicibacterium sp. 050158]|uniref:helix-turn-helix domain-containing protein n=1 Tax=Mycolicibacterium sp. 050158 TaxID=3090602 RepID=UPI00299F519F|nr:helix-turn-helix transcriptional regulator [Mycolicibacterium sp. 050158]MDX1890127.1 helix-turn-helix transcriptional regulator [Mycolicibacterium sp. 050158]